MRGTWWLSKKEVYLLILINTSFPRNSQRLRNNRVIFQPSCSLRCKIFKFQSLNISINKPITEIYFPNKINPPLLTLSTFCHWVLEKFSITQEWCFPTGINCFCHSAITLWIGGGDGRNPIDSQPSTHPQSDYPTIVIRPVEEEEYSQRIILHIM